jgi:hypothetical protein
MMMTSKLFSLDYDEIYSEPTTKRVAEVFLNGLYRKLHVQGFSILITLWGGHRVGKSLASCALADILDPTFRDELEKRVVYETKDILGVFRDIRTRRLTGAAIIIDEAGSGALSAQRWYEEVSQIVSSELQSCGSIHPIIFFVTQYPTFLNSTARKLSHGMWEVSRKGNLYSVIKPLWVSDSPWFTKSHRHYPIITEKRDGISTNVYKIGRIRVWLPPKEIVDRYNVHSQKWKDQLLENCITQVGVLDFEASKRKATSSSIETVVDDVCAHKKEYLSKSAQHGTHAFINKEIIRHHHMELTDREARLVKVLVEQRINKKKARVST